MKLLRGVIFVSLLSSSVAEAGFIDRICRAFVADDPYQYEQVTDARLRQEIERLEIQERWRKITKDGENHLRLMRDELASRSWKGSR